MTRSTCSPHLSCKDKISSGGQIFHRTMITLTDSRRWACCDAWKQYILTTTNWQQTNISLSSTSTFPWSAGRIMTSPFVGTFVILRWDINFHHNSWKWGAELVEFLSTELAPIPPYQGDKFCQTHTNYGYHLLIRETGDIRTPTLHTQ